MPSFQEKLDDVQESFVEAQKEVVRVKERIEEAWDFSKEDDRSGYKSPSLPSHSLSSVLPSVDVMVSTLRDRLQSLHQKVNKLQEQVRQTKLASDRQQAEGTSDEEPQSSPPTLSPAPSGSYNDDRKSVEQLISNVEALHDGLQRWMKDALIGLQEDLQEMLEKKLRSLPEPRTGGPSDMAQSAEARRQKDEAEKVFDACEEELQGTVKAYFESLKQHRQKLHASDKKREAEAEAKNKRVEKEEKDRMAGQVGRIELILHDIRSQSKDVRLLAQQACNARASASVASAPQVQRNNDLWASVTQNITKEMAAQQESLNRLTAQSCQRVMQQFHQHASTRHHEREMRQAQRTERLTRTREEQQAHLEALSKWLQSHKESLARLTNQLAHHFEERSAEIEVTRRLLLEINERQTKNIQQMLQQLEQALRRNSVRQYNYRTKVKEIVQAKSEQLSKDHDSITQLIKAVKEMVHLERPAGSSSSPILEPEDPQAIEGAAELKYLENKLEMLTQEVEERRREAKEAQNFFTRQATQEIAVRKRDIEELEMENRKSLVELENRRRAMESELIMEEQRWEANEKKVLLEEIAAFDEELMYIKADRQAAREKREEAKAQHRRYMVTAKERIDHLDTLIEEAESKVAKEEKQTNVFLERLEAEKKKLAERVKLQVTSLRAYQAEVQDRMDKARKLGVEEKKQMEDETKKVVTTFGDISRQLHRLESWEGNEATRKTQMVAALQAALYKAEQARHAFLQGELSKEHHLLYQLRMEAEQIYAAMDRSRVQEVQEEIAAGLKATELEQIRASRDAMNRHADELLSLPPISAKAAARRPAQPPQATSNVGRRKPAFNKSPYGASSKPRQGGSVGVPRSSNRLMW